jgi:hypothetical protein
MNKNPQYVVVIGNPFDGLTIHGPFDDADQVDNYAEDCQDDWWVVTLVPPED